ncbi:MAG: ABC transporter ATP-binding protein [Eubacteriales bacterium]|nr:ABC transporter ATP-binding protein [Desulforudis sp.]MDP3044384.1 ABC transporter ATP-binding protein [Bacillota bacterium]MDP3049806.1 ABC transporter ATP-binding protein [Eubacteriales bacterium]MDQ7789945.1 ABC transporter ATP-binding protein [Clostridia bacterium]MDZ4042958.1 ABC transporter ATP-binding protein [Eubacteriales bacterium]
MLSVRNLSVLRGHIQALNSVSFDVEVGEVVVILGANGVGKSTLLGSIAGLYPPTGGEIRFDLDDLVGLPPERIVGMGISMVPEDRQLFPALSVRDNLMLGAFHRYRREKAVLPDDLAGVLSLFPALSEKLNQPAHTLSGGLQQMVAIGRALMAKPRLLLMDEPSIGLAPLVVREIMQTVRKLKMQGHTIVLVEQNARAALRVGDRVLIMEPGRVSFSGTPEEVAASGSLHTAYLGRSAKR